MMLICGICRHCFRNHKYCSDECRRAGYLENHRKAQKKYSSKKEVKKKHAEDMKKRRYNRENKKKHDKESGCQDMYVYDDGHAQNVFSA